MRVSIYAVGRLRSGPEKALIEDYIGRFDKSGRALGLGPLTIHEVEKPKYINFKNWLMEFIPCLTISRDIPYNQEY